MASSMRELNDELVRAWLAARQAEITAQCRACAGRGVVPAPSDGSAEPEPEQCRACEVFIDGRWAVLSLGECTCGGVDIGIGTQHEPGCGEEPVAEMPSHLQPPITDVSL